MVIGAPSASPVLPLIVLNGNWPKLLDMGLSEGAFAGDVEGLQC